MALFDIVFDDTSPNQAVLALPRQIYSGSLQDQLSDSFTGHGALFILLTASADTSPDILTTGGSNADADMMETRLVGGLSEIAYWG